MRDFLCHQRLTAQERTALRGLSQVIDVAEHFLFNGINLHAKKEDNAVKAISEIPGVGLLTATATVAMMGDAKTFRSGREFAAWAGLVPKQTGSGGKVNLHGISKRGDTYLRSLLIHGARSVVTRAKDPGPWVEQMTKRRPLNVVVVALANKMARMIWAVLAHDRRYQKDYISVKPA
ncbi:IS110 family transposase [Cupriavidus necator]|uniref:IS110 family transposase n=1 Tax=Cupriavidus necator TaxID=106590 RepID=A0A1U9UN98_CUPNE|nr:IS110 family transposase [Cupriavidus necator]